MRKALITLGLLMAGAIAVARYGLEKTGYIALQDHEAEVAFRKHQNQGARLTAGGAAWRLYEPFNARQALGDDVPPVLRLGGVVRDDGHVPR